MLHRITVLLALAAIVLLGTRCQHGNCKDGSPSHHGGSRSHNVGRNCQQCHLADGPGEVCWAIGGTAYDSISGSTLANVTVRFYKSLTDSSASIFSLDGDDKGNFYTSQDPGLAAWLYPEVTAANGHTARMTQPINTGACNSCHGVSTAKITVP